MRQCVKSISIRKATDHKMCYYICFCTLRLLQIVDLMIIRVQPRYLYTEKKMTLCSIESIMVFISCIALVYHRSPLLLRNTPTITQTLVRHENKYHDNCQWHGVVYRSQVLIAMHSLRVSNWKPITHALDHPIILKTVLWNMGLYHSQNYADIYNAHP